MEIDFLTLFNESNSIKNEETGEILITVPSLEAEGKFAISVSCSITSKCNTLIKCELIRVLSESVSFSNLNFEGNIIIQEGNNFSFDNCTISNTQKCEYGNFVINSSQNVTITNSKLLGSPMSALKINLSSQVKIDKTEICNTNDTILVISHDCKVTLTNSHLHHTQCNAIFTNGSNVIEITGCIISDCQYPLLYINQSEITLNNNTFKNCEQNGVSINTSPLARVTNNIFENIKTSALSISSDSKVVINGNSFSKIGGNSIYTKLSETEIFDNIMNDQIYPAIAITHSSISKIHDNKIKNIKYNGISVRSAKFANIFDNEIDSIGECGISVSNTEKVLIENNKISNCDIASIESYNHSNTFVKNNIISKLSKNAFLCFASGFMMAENNSIDDVKSSMTKLAFKGYGEFINNKILNCPNQCEILKALLITLKKLTIQLTSMK